MSYRVEVYGVFVECDSAEEAIRLTRALNRTTGPSRRQGAAASRGEIEAEEKRVAPVRQDGSAAG